MVASPLGCSESSEQNVSETESKRASGGRWGGMGFYFLFLFLFLLCEDKGRKITFPSFRDY